MNRLVLIVSVGTILGALAQSTAGTNGLDWAPLISRDTDVNGDARVRMLGPFYEGRQANDGKSLWAVHPLISTIRDPSDQRMESDVLWPMLINKRHRDFWQWRLAQGPGVER